MRLERLEQQSDRAVGKDALQETRDEAGSKLDIAGEEPRDRVHRADLLLGRRLSELLQSRERRRSHQGHQRKLRRHELDDANEDIEQEARNRLLVTLWQDVQP